MTDAPTAQAADSVPAFLYIWGEWPDETPVTLKPESELATRLLAWLHGLPVPLDQALSEAIALEFKAQNQFRERLLSGITLAQQSLLERARAFSQNVDLPYSTAEAFARGYNAGSYHALVSAAQELANVTNPIDTWVKTAPTRHSPTEPKP